MIKFIKQLLCKHRSLTWLDCDLVRIRGNEWQTQHYWKCNKCGKVIVGKKGTAWKNA